MSREEALRLADELQVDVICISPDADPPVCRLLEYSKYRYELEKASKEAKKKQKVGRCVGKRIFDPAAWLGCCVTHAHTYHACVPYVPLPCIPLPYTPL